MTGNGGATASAKYEMQLVRVGELERFAEERLPQLADDELVPVSRTRALAQAKNPAARPDDLGLVVTWRDGRCVGFVGALPVELTRGRETLRASWLTAARVKDALQGQGIGRMMFVAACQRQRLVLGAEVSPVIESAAGREQFAERIGVLEVLRLDGERIHALLGASVGEAGREVVLQPAEALDDEDRLAIDTRPVDPAGWRFARGAALVAWMLRHPWIVEGTQPDRYTFSSVRRRFAYRVLRFHRPDGRHAGVATVMLTQASAGEPLLLKILDFVITVPGVEKAALVGLLGQARRWDADAVELDRPTARWLGALAGFPGVGVRHRLYLGWSPEPGLVSDIRHTLALGYPDGEHPFF